MKKCLPHKTHGKNVNDSYNSFLDLLIGVPEDSIFSSILFNIYICNLILIEKEAVTSYADDIIFFSNVTNVLTVSNDIETKAPNISDCFSNN